MRVNSRKKENVYVIIFLIIIFIISVYLRISGNGFGLPYEFMPDESSPHIISAVKVLQSGNFLDFLKVNIGTYPRLYWYFLAFFFKIASIIHFPADLPGTMTTATEWYPMMVFIRENAFPFFLTGRFSTALFGALIPVVSFFLARKIFSIRAGILASILSSFDFLLVKDAHYIYPDTLMTLFIILAGLFSIKYFDEKRTLFILLASFFAGVSFAIKYNSVFIFLPILLVLIFKTKWVSGFREIMKSISILIICLVIFFSLFIFSNPLVITDFKVFINEFKNVSQMYGSGMLGKTGPFGYHLFAYKWTSTIEPISINTLIYDINPIALVLGFAVALYGAFSRKIKIIIISSFAIPYYLFIDLQKIKDTRQVVILAPVLIILGSGILSDFIVKSRRLKIILVSFLIISSVFTLFRSIYLDFLFNQKDTRIYAAEWIKENIPAGSKIILFGGYTSGPPIFKPEYDRDYYQYPYYNFDDAVKNDRAKPLSGFIDDGVQYLVLNSFDMQSHLCISTQRYYPETYESYKGFYGSLDHDAKLIYRSGLNGLVHPGPIIEIYKIK